MRGFLPLAHPSGADPEHPPADSIIIQVVDNFKVFSTSFPQLLDFYIEILNKKYLAQSFFKVKQSGKITEYHIIIG